MSKRKHKIDRDKAFLEKLLENHTGKEIAEFFGCSEALVSLHLKKMGIVNPRRRYNHPDLSPSPELSYLIGVYVGDGNITKWGYDYSITLSAKDEEFVAKFAKTLATVNRRGSCYPIQKNKRGLFVTKGRSKELYYFIKKVEYYEVIQTHPHEFIEGFFDSEGSVSKTKKWNSWHITFSNTKLDLIELTQWMLDNIGIEARIYLDKKKGQKCARAKWSNKDYYKNFDVYKLQVLAKDNHKFARAIHPVIIRKKERLQTIIETTREWKEEVTCPYCGIIFEPKTYNQRFCCAHHKSIYRAVKK